MKAKLSNVRGGRKVIASTSRLAVMMLSTITMFCYHSCYGLPSSCFTFCFKKRMLMDANVLAQFQMSDFVKNFVMQGLWARFGAHRAVGFAVLGGGGGVQTSVL